MCLCIYVCACHYFVEAQSKLNNMLFRGLKTLVTSLLGTQQLRNKTAVSVISRCDSKDKMADTANALNKQLYLFSSSRTHVLWHIARKLMTLFVGRKFSKYYILVSWLMCNTFIEYTDIILHVFNKTYEEEFEEPGDPVPYKVELADADSQQR